jgi:integrase
MYAPASIDNHQCPSQKLTKTHWRAIVRLTKDGISKLTLPPGKSDYRVPDDEVRGLYVRLRADTSRRVWVIRFPNDRWQTIGDVTQIEPADARKIARQRFAVAELGGDPISEKARARAQARVTFGRVADQYLDAKQAVRRANTNKRDRHYLAQAWKPLRDLPIHSITRRDVAARLGELVKERGIMAASAARRSLGAFLSWAVREGLVDQNAAVGTNDPATGVKARDRVLDEAELRAIWRACRDDDFGRIVKLLMLTGCRREEIGGLKWSEIDMDTGILRVPGTRTKNHRELVLTLPPIAVSILASAPRREGRDLCFGWRGGPFSIWSYCKLHLDAAITKIEGKPPKPWRLHDVRRSVATHMAEIGIQPHIIEAVINHVSGHKAGVAGIYNRASYEREIKAALALWADHLQALVTGEPQKVVALGR